MRENVLLCDGASGTMYYSKGVYINSCFDELNLVNPDLVSDVHNEYIRAGVDLIETNTFGANRFKLKKFGLEDKVADINRAGARLAQEAAGQDVFIAGSIGPLGLKIEPWGPTSVEEAREAFRQQAGALNECGIEIFILETFADINEIHQAIQAVQDLGGAPVIIGQMTIDVDGNSLYGTTPEAFTKKLEEWGVDVIGVNCSVGPSHMLQCLERMAEVTEKPLSAMPNAGIPREVEGRNIYLCSPEYMAEYAKRFIQTGVKIVGGCCGTTPDHIKAMRGAIKAHQPPRKAHSLFIHPEREKDAVQGIPTEKKSKLAEKLARGEFVTSIEIVPPRGYEATRAKRITKILQEEGIDCINIPDGPRASARMSPVALAAILGSQTPLEPILHYTCRDRNLLGIQSDLLGMFAQGIRNILCLTGDPPKLGDYPDATAVFDVDAIGLTNVVDHLNKGIDIGGRKLSKPTGFLIGVGANPGAINLDYEISRFEWKVEAGAEFAITQPVYDIRLLEAFLKRIEHCRIPIIGGIWPLFSLRNAEFMHNEVPGAFVPDEIMERMRKAQDVSPERARREGVEIAQQVLRRLMDRVQGVQISPPLGKVELALEVLQAAKE